MPLFLAISRRLFVANAGTPPASTDRTAKGQVYTASGMRSAFNRACKRVNLSGFTTKDIRSMAATAAKNAGYSKKQVMVALGHKKESTTEGYYRDREVMTSEVVLTLPKDDAE